MFEGSKLESTLHANTVVILVVCLQEELHGRDLLLPKAQLLHQSPQILQAGASIRPVSNGCPSNWP